MEVNPNPPNSTGNGMIPNALGNIQRPGEYLRQVRIAQKLELAAVSDDLNIPVKTLTALEQDDYKSLPEATFIKGYYRTYAKYLKVDASNIIQRFDDIYANDTGLLPNHALNNSPIKIMGKLPGSKRERNRKWLKRSAILIAVVLILWALIATVKNWSSNSSDDTTDSAQMSEVQILSLDGTDTSSNGNVVALAGDQLELQFTAPTAVNVVDAKGNVLVQGRQANTLNLTGEAPFQIRIDNAAVVSLKLNNEIVSLAQYTKNGKADFSLSR